MARSFGEAFKRIEPEIGQVLSNERIVGRDGARQIRITAADGESIFEPMDPKKAGIQQMLQDE